MQTLLFGAKSFKEQVCEKKVDMSPHVATHDEAVKIFEKGSPKKPILTCQGDF